MSLHFFAMKPLINKQQTTTSSKQYCAFLPLKSVYLCSAIYKLHYLVADNIVSFSLVQCILISSQAYFDLEVTFYKATGLVGYLNNCNFITFSKVIACNCNPVISFNFSNCNVIVYRIKTGSH